MFCSNCGKTLKADASVCPKCGAMLGESRFEGNGYTSVQARFQPGEQPKEEAGYTPYTRTTYTSMKPQNDEDVYARTTYRPVLAEDEKDDVQEDMQDYDSEDEDLGQAARDREAQQQLHAMQTDELIASKGYRPPAIEGISPDVEAYMQRIKARKDKPKAKMPLIGWGKKAGKPDGYDNEDNEDEERTDGAHNADGLDLTNAENAAADEEDEDDDAPRKASGVGRIIGMAAGVLAIVVLLAGGFIYLSSRMAPKSNIPGVSKSLYDSGLQLLSSYINDAYRVDVMKLYQQDLVDNGKTGDAKMAAEQDTIRKLLPDKTLENDQLFIDAMLVIQKSVGNAIATDALLSNLSKDGSIGTVELENTSAEVWATVSDALQNMRAATTVQDLNSIISTTNVERQVAPVVTPTPVPTPAIYKTLNQGDKNLESIKKMQAKLIELGYLVGKADGDFGSGTKTAVKLFQQAVGMEATGIATPEFQQALYAPDAPQRLPVEITGGVTPEPTVSDGGLAPAAPTEPPK